MASQERKKKDTSDDAMDAKKVMKKLTDKIDKRLVQLGGDATTGRGQVMTSLVGGDNSKEEK